MVQQHIIPVPDPKINLMQEEAQEQDTHQYEVQKELEASVATLSEELALER